MDPSSGELTFERAVAGILNPSYLGIHPEQNFLYDVNELQDFAGEQGGGVSALSIDSGIPGALNHQPSHGMHPCHISIEQTGRFAMVANYSSGSVAMFPIQADGRLGPATDIVQHSGSSTHPDRQAGPHAHCILPDPTNRFAIDPTGTFLLAANQKSNTIVIFRIDAESGDLNRTGHAAEISMPVCLKFADRSS